MGNNLLTSCSKDALLALLNLVNESVDNNKQLMIFKNEPAKDFPNFSDEDIEKALEFAIKSSYVHGQRTIGYFLVIGISASGLDAIRGFY